MLPVSPQNILFLDIETVPQHPDYGSLPDEVKHIWDKKAEMILPKLAKVDYENCDKQELYGRAALYAEFGKIVCISVGCVLPDGNIRITSIFGDDEAEILTKFSAIFSKTHPFTFLCAHNGKSFDYPYMCRRFLINGLPIPAILNISGKKPWEINHFDTMELWKFGDFSHYASLETLAMVFGIPTPKDDLTGAGVCKAYYVDQDLPRIAIYCEKDVLTLMKVFYRVHGDTLVEQPAEAPEPNTTE